MVIINPLPAHRVSAVQTLTRLIPSWSPRVFGRTTRRRGITLGYGYLMMIITTKSGPIMFCILSLPFPPSCFASMVLIRDTVSCWRPLVCLLLVHDHPIHSFILPWPHTYFTHTLSLSACCNLRILPRLPSILTFISACPFSVFPSIYLQFFFFFSFPVVSLLSLPPLFPTLILSRLSVLCFDLWSWYISIYILLLSILPCAVPILGVLMSLDKHLGLHNAKCCVLMYLSLSSSLSLFTLTCVIINFLIMKHFLGEEEVQRGWAWEALASDALLLLCTTRTQYSDVVKRQADFSPNPRPRQYHSQLREITTDKAFRSP